MPQTGKTIVGTNKIGRQRRIIKCTATTFNGCEWMPNFKGSQRGCVLKVSNEFLNKYGVKKRSQVDCINSTDHTNHGFKKILKLITQNIKSNNEFTVTFMTPDLTVRTVEIFFRGAFCPSVSFCSEGDGSNFIIENIPYDSSTKKLIDQGELASGYRVTKVKTTKVTGKKYSEISKLILSASNDMRVDYSVVFEEGDLSWYNFETPPEPKKLNKHERRGSGMNFKKKSTKNLLKKKGNKHARNKSSQGGKKSSHHSASMSSGFDLSSVDWTKERDSFKGNKFEGNVSDNGNKSPSFSSLASVAEDGDKLFDQFELTDDNVIIPASNGTTPSKKPTLQVVHSGVLTLSLANNIAAVSDTGGKDNELPNIKDNKSDKKRKKSVNFATQVPKVPEAIDVNVMCDLCKKMFVIKDNMLKYHSLNEIENKSGLFDIEEKVNGDNNNNKKKKKKDVDIKYNGLCSNCIKMECTIELSKLDGIMLGPHRNGYNVCICYVDKNISKYIKWIIEEDIIQSKDEIKEEKKEDDIIKKENNNKKDSNNNKKEKNNNNKKKATQKFKKIRDKNLKITENFIILGINDISVEGESFEYIMSMYYEKHFNDKKIRLKLRKYFNNSHTEIVTAYNNYQNELIEIKRKREEELNFDRRKAELLTRNTAKTMIDSDPDDSDSITEEDDDININNSKNRKLSTHKRSKSYKRKRKKSLKNIRLSATSNDYDESDYGAADDQKKTVAELIDEHEAMIFIREGEKLEKEFEWEMASINLEKGVSMLEEYFKDNIQMSTRDKRTFRKEVASYRKKAATLRKQLLRRTNTPRGRDNDRFDKFENDKDNKEDSDNDKDNKKKEKITKEKVDPDQALKDRLMSDIITEAPNVSFKDVTGLLNVKLALYECVILPQKRPELFTGLRKPTAGLLLFGPPGNGKTMIAKCVATECEATFFSISASSITSKYVGEAERIMRTLFNMAREKQPSIIFIDEIDSLLTARGGNNEAESSRRIKTEFLVQFDGVKASADGKDARVLIIGATNLPEQLDEAVLRRFGKRILVPVPDEDARYGILRNLTSKQMNDLTEYDFRQIVSRTNLYSASDLTQVCKDAAMGPIRDLGSKILDADEDNVIEVGSIKLQHFESALKNVRASVKQESLLNYQKWNTLFGSKLTFELSSLPTNMHAHVIQPLE